MELDKHFRVRRQLWLQYCNRVLYGLILLFGILLYFIQIFWPFIEFDSLNNVASSAIILGFYTHLLFSAARVGIFFEAFRLGLYLSLPRFSYDKVAKGIKKAPSWNNLRLNSKRIKFSSYGENIKNFELNIKKNDRLSIYGKGNYGKTTLARIITGQKCSKNINFKLDKFRISSKDWCSYKSNNYFISANPTFDTSIGEYLLGKRKALITRHDFDSIFSNLKQHRIFDFLLAHNDLLGKRIVTHDLSTTEIVLLQIAHCLINQKSVIAIDHVCLDLEDNEKIIKGLQILDKNSPKTAIIYSSSIKNNLFTYDKTYQLSKNQFKEA
jgi:ABC-type transport system involved in cytochrome bd biosynthesis fused ATPase/permease subunit